MKTLLTNLVAACCLTLVHAAAFAQSAPAPAAANQSLNTSPAYGTQLTLVAFIRAKPGQGDELGRRLGALVEPARAEPGNINYDLHRSNDDPDVWMLYENWVSAADLEAHFQLPYMKEFVAGLGDVLQGEMDLRRYAMTTKVEAARP